MLIYFKTGGIGEIWKDLAFACWLEANGYPAWQYRVCQIDFCMN